MALATSAAILGAAAIGGIASLASGFMGANAANAAAQDQAAASGDALKLQNEQYQQNRQDTLPWLAAGTAALQQYSGELGLTKTNADGTTFTSQFQTTPGYDFQVQQGEKGVVNNLAALGMKGSGAALKSLTRFRQGLADQTYNNYLDRLSATTVGGQAQANTSAAAGTANAINVGGLTQDAAAARSSGYIGSTNALTGALGSAANIGSNALGWLAGNKGWATA